MRLLSKSKIIAYRQCPKRLWLEIHRPELRDDSGAESGFRIGHEVGEVARRVYDPEGTGKLIDVSELGYDEAFRRSYQLLQNGDAPVFEVALHGEKAFAIADLMIPKHFRNGMSWRLIEVKSSTGVKDYHRDDLAIQVFLAATMGIDITGAMIAHIDNTFIYGGDGDYRGLFHEADFTAESRSRSWEVVEWIEEAHEIAGLAVEPEIPTGPQCRNPFECPFAAHCSAGQIAAEYPLSSLPSVNANRRAAIEALGVKDLREVPDLLLTDRQRHVRDVTISGEIWFDREGAAAALADHGFPAYFLDFETVAMPVPIWKGTRPYQQIPFQFSLHRIDSESVVEHDFFLDLSGGDPSQSLAEALVERCGNSGPVYVYNAGFERMVIRQLAERFPPLGMDLQAISGRIVDLRPIAKAHFYAPSMHGSWSLKAVLPAACPDLSYESLDEVADGNRAAEVFREAIRPETSAKRREEIERQLLAYCHLDTLALVRLWGCFGQIPLLTFKNPNQS